MSERRNDFELLREFVRRGDQPAFGDVVRRHLDLVYATAWRKLEDQGAAQEVAQNVFATLARKAWQFAPDDSLPSWLYRTTLLEAKEWLRGELRRRRREQTAAELGTTMKTPDEQTAFRALLPLLDEALLSLREKDRTALLLRFYESQSLRDVGASLGISEDTAQKRVSGALEKVSDFFRRRGFKTASVSAAAAALQHTAISAPVSMAASVTTAAMQAAPITAALGIFLGRLISLVKVPAISVCVAALLISLFWFWRVSRSIHDETIRVQTQTKIAVSPPQVSLAENLLKVSKTVAEPLPETATVKQAVNENSHLQEEYSVYLMGFINTPDSKIAILEVRHHGGESSHPMFRVTRLILEEGKTGTDDFTADVHVHFEFLQADFKHLSVRLRENGKDFVCTLEGSSGVPTGEWNVCLINASFDEVVDLYGNMMNCNVLCHPALNQNPISAVAKAKDRAAAVQALDDILHWKAQAAMIPDGEKFTVCAPTNLVTSVSAGLKRIAYPTSTGPMEPSGSIIFVNAPMSNVLGVYGAMIGRNLIWTNDWPPRGTISFHSLTPLTKSETLYAFNILFSWQNMEVSLVGDDSFKLVPFGD